MLEKGFKTRTAIILASIIALQTVVPVRASYLQNDINANSVIAGNDIVNDGLISDGLNIDEDSESEYRYDSSLSELEGDSSNTKLIDKDENSINNGEFLYHENDFKNETMENDGSVTLPENPDSYKIGNEISKELKESGYSHWYKFTLNDTGIYKIKLSYSEQSDYLPSIFIYDKAGNLLTSQYGSGSSYTGLIAGTYYFYLNGGALSTGKISLKIYRIDANNNKQSKLENYEDESTRNDTENTASILESGDVYHGIVGQNNPVDWYKFTIDEDTYVQLSQRDYYMYYGTLEIRNSDGRNVMTQNDPGDVYATVLKPGTYYIRAERFNSANNGAGITSYRIVLGRDAKEEYKPYHPEEAQIYELNTTSTNEVTSSGYSGWYQLNLEKSSVLKVTISHTTKQDYIPSIFIYDISIQKLYGSYGPGTGYVALLEGTYFIKIDGGSIPGTVSFDISSVAQDDNYQSFEENYQNLNSRNENYLDATVLETDNEFKTYSGIIGNNNNNDWYKVTAKGKLTIRISESYYANYQNHLEVLDKNLRNIKLKTLTENSFECSLNPGTYYIHASRFNYHNNGGATAMSYKINIKETPQYIVSYNANKGGNNPPIDEKFYTNGDSVVVKGQGELKKESYIFKGWCINKDGSSKLYNEGDKYIVNSKDALDGVITFYAIWVENRSSEKHIFNSVINYSGYACGSFIVKDSGSKILKNTDIYYKNEKGEKVKATTDENGYIEIKSSKYTFDSDNQSNNIKNFGSELWLKPNDDSTKLPDSFEISIVINDLSYSQTWSGTVALEGELGAGLGVKAAAGPADAKASLAHAGIVGSLGGTLSATDSHENGNRDLLLKESYDARIGVNGDVGPMAQAKAGAGIEINPLTLKGQAGVGAGYIVGKEINDYNPDDIEDIKEIGKFLYGISAQSSGNVALVKLADLLGSYNYSGYQVAADASAGASVGSVDVPGADLDSLVSVWSGNIGKAYTFTNEVNSTNKRICTSEITDNAGYNWFPLEKMPLLGESSKITTAMYKKNSSESLKLETTKVENGPLEEVKSKFYIAKSKGSAFFNSAESQYIREISYRGDEVSKVVNGVPAIASFAEGRGLKNSQREAEITPRKALTEIEKTKAKATYKDYSEKNSLTEIPLKLGVQVLGEVELGVDLSAMTSTEFCREAGEFYYDEDLNDRIFIPTSCADSSVEDKVNQNSITLSQLFKEPLSTVGDEIITYIEKTKGKISEFGDKVSKEYVLVKEGLKILKRDLIVEITMIKSNPKMNSYSSYSIYAYDDTEDYMTSDGSIGDSDHIQSTIGDPYIISIMDTEENEVTDLSDAPLELSLGYNSEMLSAAGASISDAKNLSIYKYSREVLGYLYVGGVVDESNMCVTVDLVEPGQYILLLDTAAPQVSDVLVENSTRKPNINILMTDVANLSELSIKLDDSEIINLDNYIDYYTAQNMSFVYKVDEPLTLGQHKISIYAKDVHGNEMQEPFVHKFEIKGEIEEPVTIVAGQKINLPKTCFYNVAESISRYIVDKKSLAGVSKEMLTGKKPGTVKVTAQKKIGKNQYENVGECTVTILNKPKLKFTKSMTHVGQTINANEFFQTEDIRTVGATYWESAKPDVVEVVDAQAGVLEAKGTGSANITAYFGEKGKAGTFKVSATIAVKRPDFQKKEYTMPTGGKLTLAMKNVNASLNPDWVTERSGIISATPQTDKKGNKTGKVILEGLAYGDTKLIATIDGQEYECTVHVTKPSINKSTMELKVGKTGTLTLKNTKIKKQDIVWTSEDPSIATVDSAGKVKAISAGSTIIYTEAGGARNECIVTVK